MASKQTYPCFACRKAGFEVEVFLDGKDEQGRTKYLNEDGTKHIHLMTSPQQQAQHRGQYQQQQQSLEQSQQQGGTTLVSESRQLKVISRLEYAISLLEKLTEHQKQEGTES